MNITIQEYSVSPKIVIAGTQGSEGVSSLSFSFDEMWKSMNKKAVFVLPNGEKIYQSLRNNTLSIPKEVMRNRGKSLCFLVGRGGRRRLVSLGLELLVLHSALGDEEEKSK